MNGDRNYPRKICATNHCNVKQRPESAGARLNLRKSKSKFDVPKFNVSTTKKRRLGATQKWKKFWSPSVTCPLCKCGIRDGIRHTLYQRI